jgi:hypothetical protein
MDDHLVAKTLEPLDLQFTEQHSFISSELIRQNKIIWQICQGIGRSGRGKKQLSFGKEKIAGNPS